jgi:hypothetical protein
VVASVLALALVVGTGVFAWRALQRPTAAPPTVSRPATTPVATTSAPAPVPPAPGPEGSTTATEPGSWSMAVNPAWDDQQRNGVRTFLIGPGSTVAANITVVVDRSSGGTPLERYRDNSLTTIRSTFADAAVVDQRLVTAPDGTDLALVAYSATPSGTAKLSFMQVYVVTRTAAYVATFTCAPEQSATLAPTIEPYLFTLRGA